MIGLLVDVLILCLILGLVLYVFSAVPILAPFRWVANIVCVVIVIFFLIQILLGVGGGGLGLHSLRF